MPGITRRSALGTAAAAAGGLVAGSVLQGPAAAQAKAAGPLAFKYRLEAQPAKVYPGGTTREVSVRELPISKGIAGVSMRLKPGAIRELHWHANAAEWGYYMTGRARLTIVAHDGQWETIECGPGDLAYIPRGYAHYIQNISREECHFILVFDSGTFNEFSTFSITAWVANTPREVLAKNLGVPANTFADFPKKEVYIAEGPVPDAKELAVGVTSGLKTPALTHRFALGSQLPTVSAGGTLRLATTKNFPLSSTIAGAVMELKPGALRELHWHPNADEWDYFITGKARITLFSPDGDPQPVEFGPGDVAYIPEGFGHYIENIGDGDCRFLLAFNNGEYQEISLTDWMALSPRQVVASTFGVPERVIAEFRKKTGFIDAK